MESLLVGTGIYAAIVLILATGVFVVMLLARDNSLMDIAYGPLFFLSMFGMMTLTGTSPMIAELLLLLTTVWGVRSAVRIGKKNFGKPEDVRYAAWREEWLKRGYAYFVLRSFLQVTVFQSFIITLVSLPFIISMTALPTKVSFPLVLIGCAVYITGLVIESLADYQLDRFLKEKALGQKEAGTILDTGLFAYSRRPNYFGETLIWWGSAITVLSFPLGFLGLISPLIITNIVVVITGPMIERLFLMKYGAVYQSYMDRTSYFIPRFPKTRK